VQAFPHRHHFSQQTFGSNKFCTLFVHLRIDDIYKLPLNQAAIQISSLYDQRVNLALIQIGLNIIGVYLATLMSILSQIK
jgi:uncharacterized membrane protein YiaA